MMSFKKQAGRMSAVSRHFFRLPLMGLPMLGAVAGAQEPALPAHELNEIEVVSTGPAASRASAGKVKYNAASTIGMVRSMGENDIINHIKTLPGVSTEGDYGAGLVVDGADASRTIYTIAGVPVFFPYRFGALFSTFNTPHFRYVTFERSAHRASMPSRLGARVDFEPQTSIPRRVNGTVNVGMLASSLTLRSPAGQRVGIILSGRISYINSIYSGLIHTGNSCLAYDFNDFNATVNCQVDSLNALSINGFLSGDRIGYDDRDYMMDCQMSWHNSLVSLNWSHAGRLVMNHRLFYTGFDNRLTAEMPQLWINVPSGIKAVGLSGDVSVPSLAATWPLTAGYELTGYRLEPQTVTTEGRGQQKGLTDMNPGKALEARVYGDVERRLTHWATVRAGVSMAWYTCGAYNGFFPNPRVTATFFSGNATITLHGGVYHQMLHNTGLSDIGMSSDFWLASDERVKPGRSFSFSADFDRQFEFLNLSVTAGAYWRRISGDAEYMGQLFDLLDEHYDALDHITVTSGYNAGGYLSLRRESGRLTGHAGVGYGVARRHFDGHTGYLPARTDPGLSFNCCVDWRITRNWSVGANFSFAQGRRYTPANSIYIIAGNAICNYGLRNSGRLPDYHRLDLGATYRFSTGTLRHYANLSIVNAYGRRNIEIQYFAINTETGTYRLKQSASLYRLLPSLSYTVEF